MSWNSKVVWSEGMFLRPQHFQQQDRYIESLVGGHGYRMSPYHWGVGTLVLDQEALALGKVAITRAQGVFPDGTPFRIPEDDNPPSPLEISTEFRDISVLLSLPLRRSGMPEVDRQETVDSVSRYQTVASEVRDNNVASANQVVPLEVGQRRMRLILDPGERGDYATVGICRVVERLADRTVILDEAFLPPNLDCREIPRLSAFITEVQGLLHQRGDALAARLGGSGDRSSLNVAQFLRLQIVNRFEPLFAHLTTMQGLHPQELYQVGLQLAGELSTFTTEAKRPAAFPIYDHDDLQTTFAPLMEELRKALSMVEEQKAIQIPLQEREYGIRVAILTDRERPLLAKADFILAVRADIAADTLRSSLPAQIKIGAVERIAQFVNHHLPGICIGALPVAPREIPYKADFTYFRLDRKSEFWQQLPQSGGFAFHLAGEFPGIEMEFWAIKE